MKNHQAATAARNLLILREVEELAAALPAVKMLLLKGLALLPIYPSIGDRPLSDADVLIDPGDLPAARQLLGRLGFRPEPVHSEEYDLEFYRELALAREGVSGLFRLDLHWGLVSREWFRDRGIPGFQEIWSRSRPGPFDLETVRIPAPEDTLLHLCLHLALHHGFEEGQAYRDIALLSAAGDHGWEGWSAPDRRLGSETLDSPGLDWDLFLSLARRSGWCPAVYCALERARRLAAAPLPEDLLRQLAPGRARLQLIRALIGGLPSTEGVDPLDAVASGGETGGGGMGQQAGRLLQLALADRVGDAAAMVARALYPSDRWLRLRDPESGRGSRVSVRFRYAIRLAGLMARAVAQLSSRRPRT